MREETRQLLREIDRTTVDVFDLASREQAKRKEGSRRRAYEKGLTEVRNIAGSEAERELADWIKNQIESKERFPSARTVRKQGASLCRSRGHEISSGSWLGA